MYIFLPFEPLIIEAEFRDGLVKPLGEAYYESSQKFVPIS